MKLLNRFLKSIMYNMELTLHTDFINGIELCFLDCAHSFTVPMVFKELKDDIYGVENASLEPQDTVIDVGANVGMFSIYVNKKFGCKIIAFEPLKENYDNFKRNILLNRLNPDDFEIYNFAVTDKSGDFLKIGVQDWNLGGSSLYYKNSGNSQIVETITLKEFINPSCKFLKMDCEGSEHLIIPSIIDVINTFKYIGIEYHDVKNVGDALELKSYLEKKFTGQIRPEKLYNVVSIESHFI